MSEYRQYVHLNIAVEGNALLRLIEQAGGADLVAHYISSGVADAISDWTANPLGNENQVLVGIMDQYKEKLEYPTIMAKVGTHSLSSVFAKSRNHNIGDVIDVMCDGKWVNCLVDDISNGVHFLSLR